MDGFSYQFHKKGSLGRKIWRCAERPHWLGRLHSFEDMTVNTITEHCHNPSPSEQVSKTNKSSDAFFAHFAILFKNPD